MSEESEDTLIVTKEEESFRLDKLLSVRFGQKSRTYFQYLIQENKVLVNEKPCKKSEKLKEKDEILIYFSATPSQTEILPENIPLDILYEDDDILVINKAQGMVVHPAPGNWNNTLVNALLYHCKENLPSQESLRPGIVHRLDKQTSGVMIAAKTELAHRNLIKAFMQREIKKTYLAICLGVPKLGASKIFSVQAPISRHPKDRKKMAVDPEGKEAITHFELMSTNKKVSLLKIHPLTGRTHQIRVHLQSIHTPILGDNVYGNCKMNDSYRVNTLQLHSFVIEFFHPITKEKMSFCAPISHQLKILLEQFHLNL